MTITATEAAARLGVTARQFTHSAKHSGVVPLHYTREGTKMVPVFEDDAIDQVLSAGRFGEVARDLGVTSQRLAEVLLDRLPGGTLATPMIYRRRASS